MGTRHLYWILTGPSLQCRLHCELTLDFLATTAKTQNRKFETNIPRKGIRGLSPNFHSHVSLSYLYITRIGLPIPLQENMGNDLGNLLYKSLTDTCMCKLGLRPRNSFSGNT